MHESHITAEADRQRFYAILASLEERIGKRCLKECTGRMNWPSQGVYFFFEDGEHRGDGHTPRVVRVGTHAVSAGSGTTLWNRLRQHKGTSAGYGNHRGSIFRRHVGGALLSSGDVQLSLNTWGGRSPASRDARAAERQVEAAVSAYIGDMPLLWVAADDPPGKSSNRAFLERNAIALLSRAADAGASADPASAEWLGQHAAHDAVRSSALWNVQCTTSTYDRDFLDVLETCAQGTSPL
ncbi:MAG: hypothetical protein KAS72_00600 [Phycisphaerales bacterium]|nr:hypothetical protein [Phycisphaerales bacterium]